MKKHVGIAATIALMALSFSLAAWSSSSIFDRLPRTEDEVTFLFQAKTIAEGNVIAPGPEHGEFFFMSFVIVQDGQWFGKYPPGYPAVLALGTLLGQTWIVNALAASISICLLALVGRRFFDLRTGLLGATLLALSPFFIIQSGSLLSHVVALCWVLALLLLFDIMRTRDLPVAAIGVGAVAGMLLLTRPLTAVGIALPFVFLAGIDLLGLRPFWGRYLLAALSATPFVVILLVYNDATTGSPFKSAYELWWEYDKIGFGPEYGVNGHSFQDAIRNMRTNLRDLSVVLFGWPWRLSFLSVALALVAAVWRVTRIGFRREQMAVFLLAGLCVGLVAVHLLYWTSGRMYGPRYYFEIIGALALLGARGCIVAWDWLRANHSAKAFDFRAAPIVPIAILTGLVVFNLAVTLPKESSRYRDWNNVNRADLEVVQGAELTNALIFVPRPNWQTYAPLFLENSTTLDGEVIYAVDRGDERNPTLMRDFPGRAYYRYRDGQIIPLAAVAGTKLNESGSQAID